MIVLIVKDDAIKLPCVSAQDRISHDADTVIISEHHYNVPAMVNGKLGRISRGNLIIFKQTQKRVIVFLLLVTNKCNKC